MNKAEKIKVINDLSSSLSESKNLYLTDISGLNASQTSDLRRACYKADIKLSVVKNTMLHRAIETSEKDFGEITSVLKGNTSIMFSESGNGPAKIIKEFRKKNDKPILKAAFIEEAIYIGDNQLDILVAIKSREELIGEIVGLLKSPIQNLVSALNTGGNDLHGVLKTLSER